MTAHPYLTATFQSSQTEQIEGYMEELFHEGYRLHSINDWEQTTYLPLGQKNAIMYCRVTMKHISVRSAN